MTAPPLVVHLAGFVRPNDSSSARARLHRPVKVAYCLVVRVPRVAGKMHARRALELPVRQAVGQVTEATVKKFFGRVFRGLAVPLFGMLRYLATLALVCGLWWYDARYLNAAFDANLNLVKQLGGAMDASGRVEAAMRAFSAEKMLLFTEASVVVWMVGRILGRVFGMAFSRRPDAVSAEAAAPIPPERSRSHES